jgi:hypothetical protein
MFCKKYYDDLCAWRRTRAEYKTLTATIKRGEDNFDALWPLAIEAGLGVDELNGLISMSRRVKGLQAEAAKLSAAMKHAARVNAEWAELEAKLGRAPTLDEQDDLRGKLFEMETPRRQANCAANDARQAAENLKHAAELGLT